MNDSDFLKSLGTVSFSKMDSAVKCRRMGEDTELFTVQSCRKSFGHVTILQHKRSGTWWVVMLAFGYKTTQYFMRLGFYTTLNIETMGFSDTLVTTSKTAQRHSP